MKLAVVDLTTACFKLIRLLAAVAKGRKPFGEYAFILHTGR
jgi:hypothetical protein